MDAWTASGPTRKPPVLGGANNGSRFTCVSVEPFECRSWNLYSRRPNKIQRDSQKHKPRRDNNGGLAGRTTLSRRPTSGLAGALGGPLVRFVCWLAGRPGCECSVGRKGPQSIMELADNDAVHLCAVYLDPIGGMPGRGLCVCVGGGPLLSSRSGGQEATGAPRVAPESSRAEDSRPPLQDPACVGHQIHHSQQPPARGRQQIDR